MNNCNEYTLCSHLSARITETRAGFYKVEQVQNSRIVLIGVLYKRSKNDRGLLLNVCPFCKAKLGLKKPLDWIANRARMRSARPDHGGIAHRFAPGHATWNKGKPHPASGRAADTQFKPGQKPHTWHPIGHERISADGYHQVKMSDTGITRRDYININHLVWFYAGRGDIPPGHALIFKDGNKLNAALDNLELVTRAELMRRNTVHRYGQAVAQIAQLRGAITRQINRRTHHPETPAP